MTVRAIFRMSLFAVVLFWLMSGTMSLPGQRNQVPKYLRRLYRALAVRRKYCCATKQRYPQTSDMQWTTASLFTYFNLTEIHHKTRITRAHLLLHKRRGSYFASLYQRSFQIMIKDESTRETVYNTTVTATNQRLHLINLLHMVKRWHKFPSSNKGLTLTVTDTGMFTKTLWTFYPRKNVYIPALALFVLEGNCLGKYRMFPSQFVRFVNGTTVE